MKGSGTFLLPASFDSPFQGFRQFFKGGNIYLKALDAEDASYLGGSGDMSPREIC